MRPTRAARGSLRRPTAPFDTIVVLRLHQRGRGGASSGRTDRGCGDCGLVVADCGLALVRPQLVDAHHTAAGLRVGLAGVLGGRARLALRSFELGGAARLGALAQGSLACAQAGLDLAELGEVALRGRELAGSALVCRVCLRTLAADAVMRGLRLAQARGAPAGGDPRVAPVGLR